MMNNLDLVTEMYEVIDGKDSRALVNMMTADANFVFANMPVVSGSENIYEFLEGFFKSIKAIKHEDIESWQSEDKITIRGDVTYTRHDDTQLKVPFAVILDMRDDLVKDYTIYIDNSELYKA